MRCKNCGWPNKPDATVCSKCGSPLENAQSGERFTNLNSELNKTIREEDVFGNQVVQPNICPKCNHSIFRLDTHVP